MEGKQTDSTHVVLQNRDILSIKEHLESQDKKRSSEAKYQKLKIISPQNRHVRDHCLPTGDVVLLPASTSTVRRRSAFCRGHCVRDDFKVA